MFEDCLTVSTQYRRVTNRQTDRQTDGHLTTAHRPRYAPAPRGKKSSG